MKRGALLVLLALVLAGCVGLDGDVKDVETLDVGSKIITREKEKAGMTFTSYEITYKEGGQLYSSNYDPRMKKALEWIKKKTTPDSVFLCWWEWGAMVYGYTGRNAVLKAPSKELLMFTKDKWNLKRQGPLAEDEMTRNVATTLLTFDPMHTRKQTIVNRAKFVLVTKDDLSNSREMLGVLEIDDSDFYEANGRPNRNNEERVLFNMMAGKWVRGFMPVFGDEFVQIYQVVVET